MTSLPLRNSNNCAKWPFYKVQSRQAYKFQLAPYNIRWPHYIFGHPRLNFVEQICSTKCPGFWNPSWSFCRGNRQGDYIILYIHIQKKAKGIVSISMFGSWGVLRFSLFSSSSFLHIGEIWSELPWTPWIWYPVWLRLLSIPLAPTGCSHLTTFQHILLFLDYILPSFVISWFCSHCCLYAASCLVI